MTATTMLSAAVHGADDVRLDAVAIPEPGPGDALVRIAVAGICGSDLSYARAGGLPLGGSGALPLGHECSGVIERIGAEVTGFAVGQRVVINPTTPSNMIGSGGAGTFCSHVLARNVMGEPVLHAIPDSLDDETAALTEPLAVALHGVNRSGAAPGSKVVVFGAGPIGLGVVAMLRHRGVSDIIAVDRVVQRLDRALVLGARAALNPDAGDLWTEIGRLHGTAPLYGMTTVGTDQFIEVSGAPPVIPQVIANARFGAHLTVIALHHKPVPVDFTMALGKEMRITTAMAYPEEFPEVIAALTADRVDAGALISHRFPFADFDAAFSIAADAGQAAKVLLTF